MGNTNSILLLGSDEDVIKDVMCSLSLINLPLTVARTLQEGRRALEREIPGMIFCRINLKTQEKGGLLFARFLAEDPEYHRIPRVLLAKKNELELLGEEMDLFYGHLILPVVFPNFTHQVQSLLSKLAVQSTYPDEPQHGDQFDPARDPNYKFRIVQEIHAAVLKVLQSSDVFMTARPQDVPDIVSHVTNELCLRYEVKGR